MAAWPGMLREGQGTAPALGQQQQQQQSASLRPRACCADPARHLYSLPSPAPSPPRKSSLLRPRPRPPAGHPGRPRPNSGRGRSAQLLPKLAAHVHNHHNLHLPAGYGAHPPHPLVPCLCWYAVLPALWSALWSAALCAGQPAALPPAGRPCFRVPATAAGGGFTVPRRAAQVRPAHAPASAARRQRHSQPTMQLSRLAGAGYLRSSRRPCHETPRLCTLHHAPTCTPPHPFAAQ